MNVDLKHVLIGELTEQLAIAGVKIKELEKELTALRGERDVERRDEASG